MLSWALVTASAVKPSSRSTHTLWSTRPLPFSTRNRGTRSIGSLAGSAPEVSRRNVRPVSSPTSSSTRLVALSVPNRALPAGPAFDGASAIDAVTPSPTTPLSARTAVGESISST